MADYENPLSADDIRQICLKNDLEICETQWQLLKKWTDLLLKINKKVNLISRKETNFIWEKQVLSCLSLLILRKFAFNSEICDFGTGGGLPGMILAIVRPDLNLTLFESRGKKVNAVQKIIEDLKISNVQIIVGRGEELGKKNEWRNRFSYITSRGVASIIDIVNWTKGLRKKNSVLHLFKGGEIKNEISLLLKKNSRLKINSSKISLKGYQKFVENKKYLISIEFF
tara:strand:- start:917 stop:1597 length:681 start_codon:yes stop_codon:yes gene_type:complete